MTFSISHREDSPGGNLAHRYATYASLQLDYENTDNRLRLTNAELTERAQQDSGQRGRKDAKKRACQLTFYFLFCSYSSPFVRSPHMFFHMMPRLVVSSKPPESSLLLRSLQLGYFSLTQKTTYVILRSVAAVYDSACVRGCVCARGDPARRAAPSPLFVTLDWNAYSHRYIVDIRPLTSLYPLIHNIVSAARLCVGAGGNRARTPSTVRSLLGEWHYWLLPLTPPLLLAGSAA